MPQAIDCNEGTLFRWQNDIYRVVRHEDDYVIVWRCASLWEPATWRLVAGEQQERFNQYCDVQSVTVSFT